MNQIQRIHNELYETGEKTGKILQSLNLSKQEIRLVMDSYKNNYPVQIIPKIINDPEMGRDGC